MQRRSFLLAGLLSLPLTTFSKIKNVIRTGKGFKVAAGADRNNGAIKYGGAAPNNLKISQSDTDGAMCMFEGDSIKKGGPPLHIHHHQDEVFYVLKGKFRFQVGEEKFDLTDGDCLFAPRGIPHSFMHLNVEPSKLITIFQPAGKMEAFFEAWGKYQTRPDAEVVKKLFADHDMEVVGPPLSE